MTITQRIVREPNALVGAVVALLGLLVLFGVDLSKEQIGGIVTFLGAVVILLRQVTSPTAEVVVQAKPDGALVAGPASNLKTGAPVDAQVVQTETTPPLGEHRRDDPDPG